MPENHDLNRLQQEYRRRDLRQAGSDLYSYFNLANLFILQERQRMVLKMLRMAGFGPLDDFRILELGCGNGLVLKEWINYGASLERLHGTDLLLNRVVDAQSHLSGLPLTCANGECLPYSADSFDIVMQFGVLTSIFDEKVKSNIAQEMLRVLRKEEGIILWYDFWLNPTNPQTRGIRPKEIRALFPGCRYTFRKITLAPPIARKIVPVSWIFASLLEKMSIFNSHYLALIRPL
jgi:SAM-dependent methyltransferase